MASNSTASFVNPSSLSMPSPTVSRSSSTIPDDISTAAAGPSRKRARTEVSTEERKEARAHRNRIAAQNSRDKRKAQFGYLERRVAELEDENRQLRAGMGYQIPIPMDVTMTARRQEESEKEKAREKENEELRERIKTLEKGWDAVVKALAAQGLPTGIISGTPSTTESQPAPASPLKPETTAPPPTSYPISPAPSTTSLSPTLAPSQTFSPSTSPALTFSPPIFPSLDSFPSDSSTTSSTPLFTSPPTPNSASPLGLFTTEFDFESTRHLAAGGFSLGQKVDGFSLGGALFGGPETQIVEDLERSRVDDAAMEDLFREILAPSPIIPSASLPSLDALPPSAAAEMITSTISEGVVSGEATEVGGIAAQEPVGLSEAELQRILDMLPAVQSEESSFFDLEMDLVGAGYETQSVGVF